LHYTGMVKGLSYRLKHCRCVPNSITVQSYIRHLVLVPQELKTPRWTF